MVGRKQVVHISSMDYPELGSMSYMTVAASGVCDSQDN